MRKAIVVLAGVVFLGAWAQPTTTNRSKPTPRQAALQRERMLNRTGGLVEQVLPGASILILDARSQSSDSLEAVAEKMRQFCRVPFTVQRTPAKKGVSGFELAQAALGDRSEYGIVLVLLEEGGASPSLTLYPEDRAAVINTLRVCKGATAEQAAERVGRELWRALAIVAGGVNTQQGYCVLEASVLQPADLDKLSTGMAHPVVCGNIERQAPKFGLGTVRRATYATAVKEGWAAPPTNKFQQAIWERVKR